MGDLTRERLGSGSRELKHAVGIPMPDSMPLYRVVDTNGSVRYLCINYKIQRGLGMTAGGACRMTGLAIGAGLGFALTRTYLFDLAPAVLALAVLVGMLAGEALTARPLR